MKLRVPFFGPSVRLLVSCCNNGGATFLVELRGRSPRIQKIIEGGSTGLAIDRRRGIIYVGLPGGVRSLNRRLQPIYAGHKLPGTDVHDVRVCPEGLAVVETAENRLAVYARPGELAWQWSPGETGGDFSHLNSAIMRNGEWLISMFSAEGLGGPWAGRLDGVVMRVPASRATGGEIVARGLKQPHSLLAVDGAIWLCESRQKRAVRIELDGASPSVVAELPCYTRGLAVTKEFIIVGQSRSDTHVVRALEGESEARDPGMCGLWFIPRSGEGRFFVELPAQEVYDVALLPWWVGSRAGRLLRTHRSNTPP